MKKLLLLSFLISAFLSPQLSAQSISETGYPEHFAAGVIIGGTLSYFIYKKTNKKFKAWLIGFAASATVGLLKEAADPSLFNGTRNAKDFQYTALGGLIGASIVIPLRSRKEKHSLHDYDVRLRLGL